jgi:dihydroorotate dehydrogenase (fumarate)
MSNHVDVNMAASTGIHDGESFVKLLLAGASANYIVSSLYKNGFEVIETILAYLENYLKENNFESVFEIIGLLSQNQMSNQKHYQRAQFMKYFSDAIDIV